MYTYTHTSIHTHIQQAMHSSTLCSHTSFPIHGYCENNEHQNVQLQVYVFLYLKAHTHERNSIISSFVFLPSTSIKFISQRVEFRRARWWDLRAVRSRYRWSQENGLACFVVDFKVFGDKHERLREWSGGELEFGALFALEHLYRMWIDWYNIAIFELVRREGQLISFVLKTIHVCICSSLTITFLPFTLTLPCVQSCRAA